MTCREFIEFLDDYLSDTLPPERRAPFERHLSLCVDCRNYVESYKRTVGLGRSAYLTSEDEIPANVPDGLVKGILAAVAVEQRSPGQPE
jgi:anti-sigma factor RsiW